MTSDRNECYVYMMLPGDVEYTTIGRYVIERDSASGTTLGRFAYRQQYLESGNAVEVDPFQLGLVENELTTTAPDGFFFAFRDALPDTWGRRLARRLHKVTSDFDLLLMGSATIDRVGALAFGEVVEHPGLSQKHPTEEDLHEIQNAYHEFLTKTELPEMVIETLRRVFYTGSPLGGARPKITIEKDNSLWIAKFSKHDDPWDNPRVEYAALQLAERCGIDTPRAELKEMRDSSVLLVERFDRKHSPEGYQSFRAITGFTILGMSPMIGDDERGSYLRMAERVRSTSVSPEPDSKQLFTRVCFNAAVYNTDDHPKNHSMIAGAAGWRLSPAYDLIPSSEYPVSTPRSQLVCGPAGHALNRSNITAAAPWFHLEPKEAEETFDRVYDTVKSNWKSTLRSCGVTDEDIASLRNTFCHEWILSGDTSVVVI